MDEDPEPPLNTSKSKKSDEGEGRKKLKTEIESPTSTARTTSNDTPTTSKRRRKTSNEKEAAPAIKKEEEVVVEERVKHEPDKCPVCLQAFSSAHSKAYASNCFHAFDFECLLEWSKVRQQCPLCKTNFDRIIYNVLSRLEFNEFALKPKESEPTQDVIPIYPENEASRSLAEIRAPESWVVKCEPAPTSFRKLVYREKWYASPYQTASYVRTTNIELEIGDELNGATTSSSNIVTSENLECVAYKPVTQKRDISPEFLTENPAKLMRLGQFMQRELRAIKSLRDSLNGSDTSTINFILDDPLDRNRRDELINMLLRLIQTKRIDSDEFLKETKSYFKTLKFKQNDRLVQVERRYQLARHFQHELLTFASSKFETLVEYDAHYVYYKDLESIPGPKDRHKSDKTPISMSLPIILTAYKYTSHPRSNLIPSQSLRLNSFRPIHFMQPLQMLSRLQTQYTQQEQLPITVEDDENEEEDRVEEVLSDQSSFCQELTPPPKKQPDLIDLISSSDESMQGDENTNNRQSRSRSRSTRSSGQQSETKSRSGSSRRKHRHREKKSKKSSKRHKSGKKKKRNRS